MSCRPAAYRGIGVRICSYCDCSHAGEDGPAASVALLGYATSGGIVTRSVRRP